MPMMKDVLGLDLGSHSIKAVEFRQTLRGVEPVQLRLHSRADPESPLPEGMRRFVRTHQLPLDHVVCALPADRLTSRRLEFPFRDRKKLEAAVPFEIEGEIPFPLEDVMVGWEIVGGDRHHAVVQATVTPRREVSALLDGLAEWGCEPRVVEAEGLVLANLTTLFDLPGTRLLVDAGHRKTTLCVVADGVPLAARSVPLGGAALTEAIAKDRDWSLADAEQWKCEQGIFEAGFESASPGAVAVLDRLAREILRTLEALETVLGGAPASRVDGVTLFGGSARLHRMDEYLAERTGLPSSRLTAPPGGESAALVAGGDPLVFAPAVALALRGTARATTAMDFRREEFAYRTDLRRFLTPDLRWTAVFAGLALLLGLGRAVTGIVLESRRASALEARVGALYQGALPGQPVPERPVSALRERLASARERAEFLGIYGQGSALDLLARLSQQVPADLKVRFEEVTIDGRVVRIEVFAEGFEAADRLERALAEAAPFATVRAGEISTDRQRGGQTFDLTISLQSSGEEAS